MPVPLVSGKHAEPSATEPSTLYDEDDAFPGAAVLCFQPQAHEYARAEYQGTRVEIGHPRYRLYALSGGTVGVVGDLGIGGPAAARTVEELVARGVGRFVLLGHAGGLQRDIDVGEVVVAERALRDEGTSYHYLPPERAVEASAELSRELVDAVDANGMPVRTGTTWTVDAIFRETATEIERFADEGVETVDMEAASAYAVGAHRGIDVTAAFVVSDYVGPESWDGHIDDTWPHVERLLDCAVDALR